MKLYFLRSFLTKYPLMFLIFLSLLLFTYRSWEKTIIFTDELFIEDASYAMAHQGSWIIPMVNNEPDLAKPPLVYWLTAPFYILFSPHPFFRRLGMIVFGIATVVITYIQTKNWFGKTAAFWTGMFLLTGAPLVYFTKTGNFDLPNMFLTILTIYFYNMSKKKPQYLVFATFSLSIGILTRSFLATTPLAVILIDHYFCLKHRSICTSFVPTKDLAKAFLAFILIVAPWHIIAFYKNTNAFIHQYIDLPIIHHAFRNLPGDPKTSLLFYISILFLFPPAIFSIIEFTKRIRKPMSSKNVQILSWIAFYLGILTLSKTRHVWYTLPLYPPLSILAGVWTAKQMRKKTPGSIKKILLWGGISSQLLAAPVALLLSPLPQSEIITAVNIMKNHSKYNDPLFSLEHPYIPVTQFYPLHPVQTIYLNKISTFRKDHSTAIILTNMNQKNLLPFSDITSVLYESDTWLVLKLSAP